MESDMASDMPPSPPPPPWVYGDQRVIVKDEQVLDSLFINLVWGGICIVAFMALRGWTRGGGGVWQRRQEIQDLLMRPPRLILGRISQIWNWVLPLLAVSDADIVRCGGFDALILTRVLLIGLQIFTFMSVFGLAVLIPVYVSFGVPSTDAAVGSLAFASMSVISPGSNLFVLPFMFVYMFTGYACFVLYINCKCYTQLRHAYFLCLDALPPATGPQNPNTAPPSTGPGSAAATSPHKHHAPQPDGFPCQSPPLGDSGADGPLSMQPSADGKAAPSDSGPGSSPNAFFSSDTQTDTPGHLAVAMGDAVGVIDAQQPHEQRTQPADTAVTKPIAATSMTRQDQQATPATPCTTPEMAQKSILFNITNFFNPTLRMMLDYLDWVNPRQRAAAATGLHAFQLPQPYSDEVGPEVRLYSSHDPMLEYDDESLALVRQRSTAAAQEGAAPGPVAEGTTSDALERASATAGARHSTSAGAPTVDCLQDALAYGSELAPVLPYWRRCLVLRRRRQADMQEPLSASLSVDHASFGRQQQEQQSTLRRRHNAGRGTADALQRDSSTTDSSGHSVAGRPAAATHGSAGQLPAWYREEEAWDPLQPLLPGKSNVRLQQLLQVPLPQSHSKQQRKKIKQQQQQAAWHGSPQQPVEQRERHDSPAALQHRPSTPNGGPPAPSPPDICAPEPITIEISATAGSGAPPPANLPAHEHPPEPAGPRVRLVNAHHYVALVKRVHVQHGPAWEDRVAAVTYVFVQAVRLGARGALTRLWSSAKDTVERAEAVGSASAGANLSPRGSLAPSGGGAIGCEPEAAALPVQRCGSEAMAANGQPFAFNVRTARYKLMHYVGGERTVREVARYFSLFYDHAASGTHGAKAAGRAGAPGAVVPDKGCAAVAPGGSGAEEPHSIELADLKTAAVHPAGAGADGASLEGAGAPLTSASSGSIATAGQVSMHDDTGKGDVESGQGTPLAPQQGPQHKEQGVRFAPEDTPYRRYPTSGVTESDAALDPNAEAVSRVLRRLYPKSFLELVPVIYHHKVDDLIFKWDAQVAQLAATVRQLHQLQDRRHAQAEEAHTQAEEGRAGGEASAVGADGGGDSAEPRSGEEVRGFLARRRVRQAEKAVKEEQELQQQVEELRGKVRALEERIRQERAEALGKPLGSAYFALFNNARDAQALAQCNRVLQPQGPGQLLTFDSVPAPAPDDVSWPSLWSTGTWEQMARQVAAFIPLVVFFVIPIGPLQGALANLTVAVCGAKETAAPPSADGPAARPKDQNVLYVSWFCENDNGGTRLLVSLVTGVLPSVIGLLWTSFVMPHLLYFCASIRRGRTSLSSMERQMQGWFWWYSFLNTFLGAVLGGGVFSQLGSYIQNPSSLLDHIGATLPQTANFFIQFCIARAVFSNWLRLAWPHAGSMLTALFRSLLCLCRPRSLRDAAFIHMVPSARGAGFYNAILQVYMFGFAFAVVSPVILPVAWFFFLTAFLTYRYALLYVYERSYESGGRMWPIVFDQVMGMMIIFEVFTGAVLLTNRAWVLSVVLWVTLTPALLMFWRQCSRSYCDPVSHPPLTLVANEPRARVSPLVYLPPALRPGALGWHPQQGRVWEKYGIPRYYF